MSEVHAQARTTPRTRTEIKESTATLAELAERYNISKLTARKWKNRESPEDLSHRPHKLNTTLTPAQEAIAVELRCMALLPLDDLVAVVREFINPDVSRAGLDRCLRRHGVGNLRELQAKALADAGETKPALKTFKDYEPGFLHMDIKYLPQMPDESHRRYLFVAIDRATRWVFMHIYADQSEDSSVDFLNRLERAAPMKIVKLLTDNGSQFTDRFTSKKREPSGQHKFDVRCRALNIEHRLCPPRHPQTNGMVERFNARISEVVNQTRFASAADLEATLHQYVKTYNHLIPQRALKHISPVQALKDWHAKKPELFKKRVYNQPGLDTYPNDQLDLELGAAAGRSGYTLPSSVFISDDGRAYFGFEAIEQSEGLLESGRQRLDSIKAWISQQTEGSLDGDRKVLSKEWNPTPYKLTQGDLLRVYLAYLTDMANQALAARQLGDEGGIGRYIKRRFARPCWPNPDQAQWADKLMRKMLAEAQILADTFSDRWSGGLTVAEIKSAINEVQRLDRLPEYLIGEGVPEPVAVAAGAIADAHNMRDAFMVVDVGAGTTDFGLFVATRKPDDDDTEVKVFQVPASIQGLMQAGDKVDGILRAYICRHESIDENDTSGRLIRADLGRKIRSLKETLFKVGALDYVLADGTVGSITLQEFLADPTVLRFGQLVEDGFKKSLAAVDDSWLRWLAMDGVKLHVVLTGGSSTLPMMQALATGVIDVRGYKIMRAAVNPQPIWLDDFSEELSDVYPQLAVAIGGAADEMPETYTAPLTFGGGSGRTSYVAGRLQVSGS